MVVKVQTWRTGTRFPAVWKENEQQRFRHLTKEVPCGITGLLSYQIDDGKSIDSPNNNQYELLDSDLRPGLLSDIVAWSAPFHGMMKFQRKPILITRDESSDFIFLLGFEKRQQFPQVSAGRTVSFRLTGAGSNGNAIFYTKRSRKWFNIIE
jgi:hypothetical protein